ncbi:hypothetical protein LGN11_13825 [Burkholderia multivorans]|nr:hypothetical protein [Burkholderia multivorans]
MPGGPATAPVSPQLNTHRHDPTTDPDADHGTPNARKRRFPAGRIVLCREAATLVRWLEQRSVLDLERLLAIPVGYRVCPVPNSLQHEIRRPLAHGLETLPFACAYTVALTAIDLIRPKTNQIVGIHTPRTTRNNSLTAA